MGDDASFFIRNSQFLKHYSSNSSILGCVPLKISSYNLGQRAVYKFGKLSKKDFAMKFFTADFSPIP